MDSLLWQLREALLVRQSNHDALVRLRVKIETATVLVEAMTVWSTNLERDHRHYASVECWAMATALAYDARRAERFIDRTVVSVA